MVSRDRSRLAFLAPALVAGLALSGLGGCASPTYEFRPIEDPDLPIRRHGFVLYPPSPGSWKLGEWDEKNRAHLLFGEELGAAEPSDKLHATTAITVDIAGMTPEEFAKHFPTQRAALEACSKEWAQPGAERFTDLANETTWGQLHGQEYARVARRVEERGNPIEPSAVLVLETRTTWLFHPTRPGTSMRVMFSHRCRQGEEPRSMSELEERFLARMSFE